MSGVSGLVGRRSQAPQGVLPGRSSSSFDQLVVVGCADGRTSPPCCSIFTAGGDVARGPTRQAAAGRGTLHTSSLRRACFCSLAGRLLRRRRRRRLREAKIVRAARASCSLDGGERSSSLRGSSCMAPAACAARAAHSHARLRACRSSRGTRAQLPRRDSELVCSRV